MSRANIVQKWTREHKHAKGSQYILCFTEFDEARDSSRELDDDDATSCSTSGETAASQKQNAKVRSASHTYGFAEIFEITTLNRLLRVDYRGFGIFLS